jgi:hypothetical protein
VYILDWSCLANSIFNRKYATPIVSIKVGPELETFKVHQGMLTFAAEYFDKMFKGNFKEALEDSAEFPDDDPNAWTFLIDWCYEGKLPSISPPPLDAKFDEEETAACWTRLKLCCRAEKYGMILLQNLAMDSINSYSGPAANEDPS